MGKKFFFLNYPHSLSFELIELWEYRNGVKEDPKPAKYQTVMPLIMFDFTSQEHTNAHIYPKRFIFWASSFQGLVEVHQGRHYQCQVQSVYRGSKVQDRT